MASMFAFCMVEENGVWFWLAWWDLQGVLFWMVVWPWMGSKRVQKIRRCLDE
jgi:hypothetical protein